MRSASHHDALHVNKIAPAFLGGCSCMATPTGARESHVSNGQAAPGRDTNHSADEMNMSSKVRNKLGEV